MEGQTGILELSEESPEEIAALLTWIYSGTIESELNAVNLWVLGDRLRLPSFCNEVMFLMMHTYGSPVEDGGQWLSANTVEYVYAQTSHGSLLRKFVTDVICGEGPLCDRAVVEYEEGDLESYLDNWHRLIYTGGDLVVDVATVSSFSADKGSFGNDPDAPYRWANHHKYMMDTKGIRPVEDFVNGVRR